MWSSSREITSGWKSSAGASSGAAGAAARALSSLKCAEKEADEEGAGAALDTHYRYPMPPEHPLWKFPNVIFSPHISGSSLSPHFKQWAFLVWPSQAQAPTPARWRW